MAKNNGLLMVGGVVIAAVAAYVFNAGGLKTYIDSLIPWKVVYLNVGPPSAGTGVTEDDLKAAAQIVASIVQVAAVVKLSPEALQSFLENIQYDALDRQDLVALVVNLKSITCVMTQQVCTDDESNRGAQYIADTTKKLATKYGIVLSPNAVS